MRSPRALSGSPAQSGRDAIASPLSELVAKVTGRAAPNLTPDADLERDLGLSSLERVELLGALEDRYQVDLSETSFANAATVADIEKLLRSECTAAHGESGGAAKPRSSRLSLSSLDLCVGPRPGCAWPRIIC